MDATGYDYSARTETETKLDLDPGTGEFLRLSVRQYIPFTYKLTHLFTHSITPISITSISYAPVNVHIHPSISTSAFYLFLSLLFFSHLCSDVQWGNGWIVVPVPESVTVK